MKLVTCMIVGLCSLSALAIQGSCRGFYGNQEIVVNVYGPGMDPLAAVGTVLVAGKEVAQFEGQAARINYFTLSGKVTNGYGDTAEAKVTDMGQMTGVLKSLKIAAHGINWQNIPMKCVGSR